MARCWTCGSGLAGGALGHFFTCPLCEGNKELKRIRERVESSGTTNLYEIVELLGPDLSEITGILEAGFEELSGQLANISSILEWGFEEIGWKLEQMTGVLQSIDRTLKSPSRTQANEWRQIAEELRRRGVLDESEKYFLKSLEANPLDFRTYIGLGKTYLQTGKLDKARVCWEKSLPHAPKGEIDYRSYSYRLIGRTYFCEGDIQRASQVLKTAIELSPNYYLGHYDYAQYCALVGDKENCLSALKTAVIKEPILLELAKKEQNLQGLIREITEYINKQGIQRGMRFRKAWRELGISYRCIDKIVNALNDLFKENEGETVYGFMVKETIGRVLTEEKIKISEDYGFQIWQSSKRE